MSKDRWFANYERALNELEDDWPGADYDMIEEKAAEIATEKTRDQLEDMADLEIMRRKEDGQ